MRDLLRAAEEEKEEVSNEEYLLSLTEEQKVIYRTIRLFIIAVGHAGVDYLPVLDFHRHFPVAVRSLGLEGQVYESVNDKVPAISVYLRDDGPDVNEKGERVYFMPLSPIQYTFHYSSIWGKCSETERERYLSAAKEFKTALRKAWDDARPTAKK